ncbi:hypothetical protein KGY77_11015 [Candidatus Bipolaricaulota bacterium]|nr:hypothetical protein [Candidatus Bipolaricaulota bacterium]
MQRELRLSLVILIVVVSSVFFLGFIGLSCDLWTHAALSSAKKVGTKLLLRAVQGSKMWHLPVDRFPWLERFLAPGV